MGDWEPKTAVGGVGIFILLFIYFLCSTITYPFRLAGYFWKQRWYIKAYKSLPPNYNWPKWRT